MQLHNKILNAFLNLPEYFFLVLTINKKTIIVYLYKIRDYSSHHFYDEITFLWLLYI